MKGPGFRGKDDGYEENNTKGFNTTPQRNTKKTTPDEKGNVLEENNKVSAHSPFDYIFPLIKR